MAALKRGRGEDREVETLAMANCSKLLSRVHPSTNLDGRVYSCKICNKQFQSSQALGGHCARHKMPSLKKAKISELPAGKGKVHDCPICGMGFALSQALGGHMRRHRAEDIKGRLNLLPAAVLKRSSSKRILCLDLNLTPYENDLNMGFQMSSLFLI